MTATADGDTAVLDAVLATVPRPVVACSGGVDSLLLATLTHRRRPGETVIAHDVTPAVPAVATARVLDYAHTWGWDLHLVRSAEFADPRYLANPVDRCYFCKTHLYDTLDTLTDRLDVPGATVLSGANLDDLGEYRPGLAAAAEHGVRHPYIEAGIGKADIRRIAGRLGLDCAELPASPCLASRLYTGTDVTPSRLRAIEVGEELLRSATGLDVVRCRIKGDTVLVEVPAGVLVADDMLDQVGAAMRRLEPSLIDIRLDERPYHPGRAFQLTARS
jgi:uncharacterized protein